MVSMEEDAALGRGFSARRCTAFETHAGLVEPTLE